MGSPNHSTFCLLCNKEFASPRNLKRHANYAHKLCDTPAYVCNFCHTGFVRWEDYEQHHSHRLMKTFARKTKKRKVAEVKVELPDTTMEDTKIEPVQDLEQAFVENLIMDLNE